jgi:hypothetical protein
MQKIEVLYQIINNWNEERRDKNSEVGSQIKVCNKIRKGKFEIDQIKTNPKMFKKAILY